MTFAYPARLRHFDEKPTFRPSETVSLNTWAFVGTNRENAADFPFARDPPGQARSVVFVLSP